MGSLVLSVFIMLALISMCHTLYAITFVLWIAGYKVCSCQPVLVNNLVNSVSSSPPERVPVLVNSLEIPMEIDTGSGVSLMSLSFFETHFSSVKLVKSCNRLKTISSPITIIGEAVVLANLPKQKSHSLKIVVCKSDSEFVPLLGREWLDVLIPNWREAFRKNLPLYQVNNVASDYVSDFQKKYPSVFEKSDSPIKGFKAHLTLKDNVSPIFLKAYSVPYAMLPLVEAKLDEFVKLGKANPVTVSNWASPAMPIPKKNGSIRFVVDFKRTLNLCLRTDVYPIPKPEDIFASMANGQYFCVLDLEDAYTQLEIDEVSQELFTVNTHKGLYRFNRLWYGVSSAPAIFQQCMDKLLYGLPGVFCYLDDILIKGSSLSECLQNVDNVLKKLNNHNVRINAAKCKWFATEVEYLGYVISYQGRKAAPSKVSSIVNFLAPTGTKQLNSFLGLINVYSSLLPNLSTVVAPLRELAKRVGTFIWSEPCQKSFECAKALMASNRLVMHYDPKLPIFVFSDASPYGVGAMLAHQTHQEGKLVERPVLFANATLSDVQKRYSQIDREALAVMFAISKFHKYIWGRKFTLVVDNEPLRHILNPSKCLPILAATRLQHWSAILSGYQFDIEHRKSPLLGHVDALSRMDSIMVNTIFEWENPELFKNVPLLLTDIADETCSDPTLSKVLDITRLGWSNHCSDPALKPYFVIRHDLSIDSNCLLYGNRVIIPLSLQAKVLAVIHDGHPGVVRSKLLARSYFWWPSMNRDIEVSCQNCTPCSIVNDKQPRSCCPWPSAKRPFERIHIDFCELNSVNYLIVADSFSKWVDINIVPNHTTDTVIECLCKLFSNWGPPDVIVSDNEKPFDSVKFREFLTTLNIVLLHSPEYHPESNGRAENSVKICKKFLKKSNLQPVAPLYWILFKFLWNYRNTPNVATGKTPNELLLNFQPKTLWSQLNPKSINPVSLSTFKPGDRVVLTINKQKLTGIVVRALSSQQYLVNVQGVLKKPHVNQIKMLGLS